MTYFNLPIEMEPPTLDNTWDPVAEQPHWGTIVNALASCPRQYAYLLWNDRVWLRVGHDNAFSTGIVRDDLR